MPLKHFSGFQVTHVRSSRYAPGDLEEGLNGVNLLAMINITDYGQNEKKLPISHREILTENRHGPILLRCLCLEIMRNVFFFFWKHDKSILFLILGNVIPSWAPFHQR